MKNLNIRPLIGPGSLLVYGVSVGDNGVRTETFTSIRTTIKIERMAVANTVCGGRLFPNMKHPVLITTP